MTWQRYAACRDYDPTVFFPLQARDAPYAPLERPESADEARRVCAGCSVRQTCLRAALDGAEGYGIFGGLTAAERAALVRRAA